MISLLRAKEIIASNLKPVDGYEYVNIEDAYFRVSFQDIYAEENILNFKRCAVDGFAVRETDLDLGMKNGLTIIGSVDPGKIPKKRIKKGECIKVSTGSVLPEGCDLVVMIEDIELKENKIIITKEQTKKNYDEIGSDVKKGEKILKKGEILNEAKIGLVAASGKRKIAVFKKPCIGLFVTGNELKEPGKKIKLGEVYNSNAYMLYSKLKQISKIKNYGIIKDDYKKIKEIFDKSNEDLIITTGGTSMGEKDIVYKIIEKEGEMLFHKISIKPGKPTFFGRIKDKYILGLPGNPASCYMLMQILLIPEVKRISRIPQKTTEKNLEITEDIKAENRELYLPVKVNGEKATPTFKHSGAISSVTQADGYTMVKANEKINKGEKVKVILFD